MNQNPLDRIPAPIRTIAVVAVLLVVGGGAAFVLADRLAPRANPPVATHGAGEPTPAATPHTCPSSPPGPTAAAAAAATPPTLPYPVWVNDPLGVHLRGSASASSASITILNQGTQSQADQDAVDGAGAHWLHVSVGSQTGWVRADFVTSTPVHVVSGDGFSLMLPNTLQLSGSSGSLMATATSGLDPLPFLTLATTRPGQALVSPAPTPLRHDVDWSDRQTRLIQVWNYTVLAHLARAPIDACQFASAPLRPDGGWPYTTYVRVASSTRTVEFLFISERPNDPVVDQILNSVAMS